MSTKLTVYDDRGIQALNGGDISICYTLKTDDITKGEKKPQTPYVDRIDEIILKDGKWIGELTNSTVEYSPYLDGVSVTVTTKSEDLSEFGVNLPFNFMGKKNGGGWKNQLLFNSPYTSPHKRFMYFYLTNPQNKCFVVAITSKADGWKMDYSPYCWGHFFVNLKLLANYDRAYATGSNNKSISFVILPVSDFSSCLDALSKVYNAPFLDYDISGGELGTEINLIPFGSVDSVIEEYQGKTQVLAFKEKYKISHPGEVTLTPAYKGVKGAPVTVYGYESLYSLYKKSVNSVDLQVIERNTDGNLCEHQCWASATLRFLIKYGSKITKEEKNALENKVKCLLDIITEGDEGLAIPHRTILNKPHDRYPAYNVYKSCRVQELAHGITILLDAYRYFKDEKYLTYLKGAVSCLISYYQRDDGRIEVVWDSGCCEDYTTVCCPMIQLCDVASFFKGTPFGEDVKMAASKMARYLYNRGLVFPTEGGVSEQTEMEMEDGSISCTALALLYYCYNLEKRDEYIKKAKEILDMHESWVIKAPICQMHGSSLRWWETQWEGDADGPAICAGHAWSIWRGEADLLYYLLTKDETHKIKARNTFLTNLSKIREDGTTYSTYNPDEINGGGFSDKAENVKFEIAKKFSATKDCGISRYVWIRIGNYIK